MFVGIDPSYLTGMAIVAPTAKGPKVMDIAAMQSKKSSMGAWERRGILCGEVARWIHERVQGRAVTVAIEVPYAHRGKSSQSLIAQSAIVGGIMQSLFDRCPDYTLVSITPAQAKHALGLRGRKIEKDDMIQQLEELTNIGKRNNHVGRSFAMMPGWKRQAISDACHVAIAAMQGQRANV